MDNYFVDISRDKFVVTDSQGKTLRVTRSALHLYKFLDRRMADGACDTASYSVTFDDVADNPSAYEPDLVERVLAYQRLCGWCTVDDIVYSNAHSDMPPDFLAAPYAAATVH